MVMKLVSLILVFILTGINVTAAVPSGASTGIYEAVELRDGDKNDHLGKVKHYTRIDDLLIYYIKMFLKL